jgi:hypothetical protein
MEKSYGTADMPPHFLFLLLIIAFIILFYHEEARFNVGIGLLYGGGLS